MTEYEPREPRRHKGAQRKCGRSRGISIRVFPVDLCVFVSLWLIFTAGRTSHCGQVAEKTVAGPGIRVRVDGVDGMDRWTRWTRRAK